MGKKLVLATRKSPLALAQAELVAAYLLARMTMSHNHPGSGNARDERNPAITAAWIGAAAVVVAALITVVFHSGHGTSPTPGATTTIGGTGFAVQAGSPI